MDRYSMHNREEMDYAKEEKEFSGRENMNGFDLLIRGVPVLIREWQGQDTHPTATICVMPKRLFDDLHVPNQLYAANLDDGHWTLIPLENGIEVVGIEMD